MKKVLIVTFFFPPHNQIASRRYAPMVPYFQEYGWKPYILTAHSKGDLFVPLPKEQIFREGSIPDFNLDIPSKKSLKTEISKLRRKCGFVFRLFDSVLYRWSSEVLSSDTLMEILKKEKFDLMVASYGPSSSLRLGSKLALKLNIPIIYDFRDLGAIHQGSDFNQNFIAKYIDRLLERKYLKNRSLIITVSNGLAERIKKFYTGEVEIIYNGWAKPEIKEYSNYRKPLEDPYIYYAGRFYQHQMAALFLLIENLKSVDFTLIIRSVGPFELENKIVEYSKKCGVSEKVKVLPKVSADIADFESQNATVNLVIEDMDKRFESLKGVLTGKLLQLLLYKAPVLAIARDDSEIGKILKETDKGVLVSSKEELLSFFNRDFTGLEKESAKTKENIERYSKRAQAEKLVSLLNRTLKESN